MNNPCKECLVKCMCRNACDDLVVFLIRHTDSRRISEDLLDYAKRMAHAFRNDLYSMFDNVEVENEQSL